MAKITISDLHPSDANNLLNELSYIEFGSILGGESKNFAQLVNFEMKNMQFILLAYAMNCVVELVKSFQTNK